MLRHERSDALQVMFNLQERELVAQFSSCRTGKSEIDWEDDYAQRTMLTSFAPNVLQAYSLIELRVHISCNVCEIHTDYTFASVRVMQHGAKRMLRHERSDALQFSFEKFNLQERDLVN